MSKKIDVSHTSDTFLGELFADLIEFLGKDVPPWFHAHFCCQSHNTCRPDSAIDEDLEQQFVAERQQERRAWRLAMHDWLRKHGKTTVFDFRGGLGDESLFLARSGFIPIYYDVPGVVYSFACHRFAQHGVTVETVNRLDSLPSCDAIITSELFTRCNDPIAALRQLLKRLPCGIPLLIPPTADFLSNKSLTAVEYACEEEGFSLVERLGSEGQGMVFVRPYRINIIIPVYDAPEHVTCCIESVRHHTSTGPQLAVRVVLINDASSDQGVLALLAQIDTPGWLVLSNKVNQGFVRTVNRGIVLDPNADVVLLNSGTQVTQGWLTGLLDVAYSAQDIATVTALSNAASLYTWPQESIHETMTPDALARLVAECSPKLRPTVPTAGRFCTYIKRDTFNKIGFFDESYGPGCEAEHDFCMRATAKGYRHILADDVFVWHQGSLPVAGSAQESEVVQKNKPLSMKRDLAYRFAVHEFLAGDLMDQIRYRLTSGVVRHLACTRRRILYVLHKPFDQDFIGGTEFHVEELVRNLRYEYICYVLYPEGENHILGEFADAFVLKHVLPNSRNGKLIEGVLRGFGIDIVHIQHLMGMPSLLPTVARAMGIPVVLSIHDHFPICPNLWLVDPHGQFCGLPSDPLIHKRCLEVTFEEPTLPVSQWRALYAQLLRDVDLTIFFSEDTRQRFSEIFSLSQARVFPYGIRVSEKGTSRTLHEHDKSQFSVCFLGYANTAKGKDIIQEVAPQLAHAGVHVHFLGSLEKDWPISWPDRFRKQMFFHGRYKVDEVVTRLREIDSQLVCILSVLPETFSRTLSEAWAAGIPVVVGPVGAQAERVRQTGGGIVLPVLKANAVMAAILELKHNREAHEALRLAVKKIPLHSELDMVEEYRTLYRTILTDRTPQAPREEFVTALVSHQVRTQSEVSTTDKLILRTAQDGQTTLERPEQMRDLMPRTVVGQLLGLASMTYLRAGRVGWKETLGRPLRKLMRRLM